MRLDKTKPHAIPKDPAKAAAERRAKSKVFGEAVLFLIGMGFILWWVKSPETLKQAFHYLKGLLT